MTPPAGPSTLDALLAAIGELPGADRAPALRARLEYGLDVAEADEAEFYTFLSECALLAVDSMQDVRLHHLEVQVDNLADPPPKPWGEVVTDVVLAFAMQAAILLLWEGAVAGVILVRSQMQIRAAQRAAEAAAFTGRTTHRAMTGKLAALKTELDELASTQAKVRILTRGGYTAVPDGRGWLVKPAPGDAVGPFPADKLVGSFQRLVDRTTLAQQATQRNAVEVARALATYDELLAGGAAGRALQRQGWGDGWRDTIGSEKGGVIVAVTQAALEGAIAAQGSADPASGEPFLVSEVAGRYLDWAGEERLAVAQTYANLRLTLRSTSDADLVAGDSFLRHLGELATEVVQHLQEVRQRYRAARPAVTLGFEAVFWREYLQANGVLQEDDPAPAVLLGFADPGGLVSGHLILERFQDDPAIHETSPAGTGETRYVARRYPGAARIPDLLAANLYRRFAAPYYAVDEHAKTLKPFTYVPGRYAAARVPPADGLHGYPDPAGLLLIDEMRFLVVRFFLEGVRDEPVDLVSAALAGATAAAGPPAGPGPDGPPMSSRAAWLAAQPLGEETAGPDAAADAEATRRAEEWFALMAAITPPPAGSPVALELAELRLVDSLTDLNLDIQAYVFLTRGLVEAAETPDQRDAAGVLARIEDEQRAIAGEWLDLLAQAGTDQERLKARFQAAVDAVGRWRPGTGWVWYGPDQTRP